MNNMNFYPRDEQSQQSEFTLNGKRFIHDPVTNTSRPAPQVDDYVPYIEPASIETNEPEAVETPLVTKERRRHKYSLGARVWMGSVVVGAVVLPPVAHAAAEQVASQVINFSDPRPDITITQENLLEDIGITINKIGGGQNG